MAFQVPPRFRSDLVAKRAGRSRFDGFVEAGFKPPPHVDELIVEVSVGQPFPCIGHACWWVPDHDLRVESAAEQAMSWEGGPAAPSEGVRP